ncbi:alpha/beta hydrolase [Ancylobacter dichloromethanicus]|uniref:Esterase n=1 Tax=Ancylobacter dichloromethanicus TaxID=518825 RepID=A0A9W6MZK9_9HYPH|nr:alpha/beta hydrolase-fold protein [Ancylobacter dichloromethanicus]MBS7555160.1 alpha/beta hydrolase [Ancylobacter dichloromethanicus]GLK72206.1 esterase [Ancylobacter dichloromethanicus]
MNPVTLPDAEWFDLAPEGGGAPWRIFLARPPGEAPAAGFPALFMLDANAGFATFVEVLRRGAVRPAATGIGPAVLVGIGYREGEDARARRTFDYTTGPGAEAGRAGERPTGGRDAFLAFIEQVLKPHIAREVPLDPARQTLFGHSLAGWFTLDVMARDSAAFRSYVAVSPSLWWDEARLIEGLALPRVVPPRLSMMVGEWEQALAPWQAARPEAAEMAARRARRGMVARAQGFAARARDALGPGAEVQFEVLAGEDHASILPAAMARALRFALAGAPAGDAPE